jgi:hypothetical protein
VVEKRKYKRIPVGFQVKYTIGETSGVAQAGQQEYLAPLILLSSHLNLTPYIKCRKIDLCSSWDIWRDPF